MRDPRLEREYIPSVSARRFGPRPLERQLWVTSESPKVGCGVSVLHPLRQSLWRRWVDRARERAGLIDHRTTLSVRTRAGLPKAVAPAGMSRVTTLPAPISASSPMLTPGRMIAPPPIQTLRPMRMGRPNSNPAARPAGSRG